MNFYLENKTFHHLENKLKAESVSERLIHPDLKASCDQIL